MRCVWSLGLVYLGAACALPAADKVDVSRTSSTGGHGGAGGTGGGACPGVLPDVGGLSYDMAVSTKLHVRSERCFDVVIDQLRGGTIARYYRLPEGDGDDLAPGGGAVGGGAGSPLGALYEPFVAEFGASTVAQEYGTGAPIQIVDQLPARILVVTSAGYDWGGTNGPPNGLYTFGTTYAFYPSGRVGLLASVTSNASGTPMTTSAHMHEVSLAQPASDWILQPLVNGRGVELAHGTDAVSFLVLNGDVENLPASDDAANAYWTTDMPFGGSGTQLRRGELQLCGSHLDAEARGEDVLSPATGIVTGSPTPSFHAEDGAYHFQATGVDISFVLGGGVPRHSPAFVVANWPSPVWSLTLGGKLVGSSACNDAAKAVGFYDGTALQLVVVYLDVISASAPDPERTFVLGSGS